MGQATAACRRDAIAYLRTDQAASAAAADKLKMPQRSRIASCHWLCCVGHALVSLLGFGLAAFRPSPENLVLGPDGHTVQRQLAICIDQGSSGWCPAFCLLFRCRLNLVLLSDPFHRICNDLKTP